MSVLADSYAGHDWLDIFSGEDKRILTEEVTHKWRQTPMLYYASWIVMFGQQFCGVNVIGMRFVFMI
jgi:hypothetical protein